MATLYLSPSNQADNLYAEGLGSERDNCNKIADVVQRELATQATILRPGKDVSICGRANQANASKVDLYVAIHSNGDSKTARGVEIWRAPGSTRGEKLAAAILARLKTIYVGPNRGVKAGMLYELVETDAPAIIIEVAFHDNPEDAKWIVANTEAIGKAIAQGVLDYLGISTTGTTPAAPPSPVGTGSLTLDGIVGALTISGYQAARRLTVDGIAGPVTVKDMQELVKAPYTDGRFDGQTNLLVLPTWPALDSYTTGGQGSRSVKALQKWLGTDPDGLLGPNDARALQRFLNAGKIR